jgi:nitrite reductase/ring-hydroxylating ferredoxin subunit
VLSNSHRVNKGNNKITELRTIFQRESQNSYVYKQTKSVNNRARTLAKVSGKIIAMTRTVGFITQIMTRCMFSGLKQKLEWNSNLNIYHKQIACEN